MTYQNRGHDYSRLGNQQQALADFNKVLSMNDPKVPLCDTYREMGVAYYRMNRIDDAVVSAPCRAHIKKAEGAISFSLAASTPAALPCGFFSPAPGRRVAETYGDIYFLNSKASSCHLPFSSYVATTVTTGQLSS